MSNEKCLKRILDDPMCVNIPNEEYPWGRGEMGLPMEVVAWCQYEVDVGAYQGKVNDGVYNLKNRKGYSAFCPFHPTGHCSHLPSAECHLSMNLPFFEV